MAFLHCQTPCLVHGDLTPKNIMVEMPECLQPQAKLLDFGLARAMTSKHKRHSRQEGRSGRYMAPEAWQEFQTTGQCKPDPKADIFSVAWLLNLVAGGSQPPVRKSLADELLLSQIWGWDRVLKPCLASESWRRPTMQAVHNALFCEGESTDLFMRL